MLRSVLSICLAAHGAAAHGAADEASGLLQVALRKDCRDFEHPAWLPSCKKIFLDLGSNSGVQVRKFFEAEKYPDATITPYFDRAFGDPDARRAAKDVCVLGVEPNPNLRDRLLSIQEAYAAKSWKVHFYPVAAWDDFGSMMFKIDGWKDVASELVAHDEETTPSNSVDVCTVDLTVLLSQLPAKSVKLAKMDIEGAEWQVLPKMRDMNQTCSNVVSKMLIELHWGNGKFKDTTPYDGRMDILGVKKYVGEHQRCEPTDIELLDDESYIGDVDDDFGLLCAATPPKPKKWLQEKDNMVAVVNNLQQKKDLAWIQAVLSMEEVEVSCPKSVSEPFAWIMWIADNYLDLPQYVTFLQGDKQSWHASHVAEDIARLRPANVTMLAKPICRQLKDYYYGEQKELLDVVFPTLFGMSMVEGYEQFNLAKAKCCSEMVVSREAIRRTERGVYSHLANVMRATQGLAWSRVMERIYEPLFSQQVMPAEHVAAALDEFLSRKGVGLMERAASTKETDTDADFMASTEICGE